MTSEMRCRWGSRNCDGAVERYVVSAGKVAGEHDLCRFHGQAWPRVGETAAEAERRTRHVRFRLTSEARLPGHARQRRNRARRTEAVDTGSAT